LAAGDEGEVVSDVGEVAGEILVVDFLPRGGRASGEGVWREGGEGWWPFGEEGEGRCLVSGRQGSILRP
jgi:hypothetical protein